MFGVDCICRSNCICCYLTDSLCVNCVGCRGRISSGRRIIPQFNVLRALDGVERNSGYLLGVPQLRRGKGPDGSSQGVCPRRALLHLGQWSVHVAQEASDQLLRSVAGQDRAAYGVADSALGCADYEHQVHAAGTRALALHRQFVLCERWSDRWRDGWSFLLHANRVVDVWRKNLPILSSRGWGGQSGFTGRRPHIVVSATFLLYAAKIRAVDARLCCWLQFTEI